MGLSISIAAAIIGVSIVAIVGIMAEDLLPTITGVSESYNEMKDRSIEQVQTDINITAVSTSANGSNHDANITLKNTGSICLKTSYFDILVNGTSQDFVCNYKYHYPESTIYFDLQNIQGNEGIRKLKVVTNNGISDYYTYTIS